MELKLTLKAIMQSYGGENPWTGTRDTKILPTETAIKGLIECAFGLAKQGSLDSEEDEIIRQDLWKNIEISKISLADNPYSNEVFTDYQIVRPLTDEMKFPVANGSPKKTLPQIYKEYISDGKYEVTLSGPEDYILKIKEYILHPVYPYFLGRACCIPSEPLISMN